MAAPERLSSEEARVLLELPEFEPISRSQVRASYRRLALQHHPDKNQGSEQAAALFRLVTLACAVLTAEVEDEEQAGSVRDFDFEEWNAAYQVPSLEQILKLAVAGADSAEIEMLLRMRGQHRPPANFGMAPYPPFEASDPVAPVAVPTTQSLVVPKNAAEEARLRKKAQAALAELGSDDSDQEDLGPVDMEALFSNIQKQDGLDTDGKTLSENDSDFDEEGYC
mmetsp:Transcript_44552/g.85221  ORF Transcript_44552/g.85221 Transcript_44552/m.85221 type:complete len:224 (+) Transcript_44552:30-701(+)